MPRLRQRGMLVDDEAQAAHYQRVEVSLRTHWAHALAVHTGSCIAHRDPRLFNEHHDKLLAHVENVYGERSEVFLKRYLDRGEEPPIWALCEVLSLGKMRRLLEERPDLWAGMGCPAGWNTFDIWRDEVAE